MKSVAVRSYRNYEKGFDNKVIKMNGFPFAFVNELYYSKSHIEK